MDDSDDGDSQPDQYARDNLLSLDSQVDPFSLIFHLNGHLPEPTPDAGPDALTDDSFLSPFHLPTVRLQEQLDVPKDAIKILAGALRPEESNVNDQLDTPLAQYDARRRLSEIKLELPALVSDPDFDCRELARDIQAYRQPDYSPEMFPSERLNAAMGEGLEFPESARRFGQALDRVIGHEKLDVPKEAVVCLARALEDDCPDDEMRKLLEETMPRRTYLRDLAMTPPLSPPIQHEEFFIPDAKVCEIPIMSDSSSMLSEDVKMAESAIMQKELEKNDSPMFGIDTPQLSPLLDQPVLSREVPKISSIKIESPVLPFASSPCSNEGANIPALLKSMDMDHALTPQSSSGKLNGEQTTGLDGIFDNTLTTFLEETATTAMRRIEQEQVSIASANARMEVPITDFSIPVPEWQNLPMNIRAHIKWLHEMYRIEMPLWPRNSRVDSQLRWVPFLQKLDPKALIKETIDCERDLSEVLNFPDVKDVPTSADYVWKRPGLAILREPDSEDDIEEVNPTMEVLPDLASLARKRRLESDCVETERSCTPRPDKSSNVMAQSHPKGSLQQNVKDQTNLLPGTESLSAVSTLLSSFINIRTAKRRKKSQSSFFDHSRKPGAEPQLGPDPEIPRDVPRLLNVTEQPETSNKREAPCPKLDIPNMPTQLIKGLSLSRGLFSRLEELYPTAEIIERDFDRWDTAPQGHNSVPGSSVDLSVATEADVIVSPATGIITTTLLKVIQKPLPGRGGQSSIRERINGTALRYERLIVLVSEGNALDETVRDLTPSETTAYADFVCFAAGLDATVEVFYVGGGEATLAKWLVSFAIRHAPEAAEIQKHLTQDETQWEVLLRRMGFNAYAAQAILIRLRRRHNLSQPESKRHMSGLAEFMLMSAVDRIQRFRDLIGGERVLRRVNKLLETKWS